MAVSHTTVPRGSDLLFLRVSLLGAGYGLQNPKALQVPGPINVFHRLFRPSLLTAAVQ